MEKFKLPNDMCEKCPLVRQMKVDLIRPHRRPDASLNQLQMRCWVDRKTGSGTLSGFGSWIDNGGYITSHTKDVEGKSPEECPQL